MVQARLVQAVCTVAMLAAAPAWAQSNNPPTNAGTSPPTTSTPPGTMPSNMAPTGSSSSAGSSSMDNSAGKGAMDNHAAHRSAMRHGMMHGRQSASSQDEAVDRLNDQSYQAARQGQAYNGGSSGTMPQPSGSSNMQSSPGGSMPNGGTSTSGGKS